MRRFLVGAAIVALLLPVIDVGLRVWSQFYIAGRIEKAAGLSERPSVSFGGFPFIPEAIRGEIPTMTVTMDSITVNHIPFTHAEVTLHHVRFSATKVVSGGGTVRARSGEGILTMSSQDLTQALGEHAPIRVKLEKGRIRVAADGLPANIEATASLQHGVLVVHPVSSSLPASISVDLPQVLPGLSYRSFVVKGSEALVAVVLRNAVFEVGGS